MAVIQILQGAISYYAPTSTFVLVNSAGLPSAYGVLIAGVFSLAFFYVNYIGLTG
ncbi:hypothetical protein [Thermogymnomonas acidicola]|uniref:hypothetical protein n=1 Tax=Thermogymnomonas acidicola TaxID=399579 RepID=UPI001494F660|nr:hypothetical protein [Thermogymnomonas acidicola]